MSFEGFLVFLPSKVKQSSSSFSSSSSSFLVDLGVGVSGGLSFYLVPIYWKPFFVIQLLFMVTKFMEQCLLEKLVLSPLVNFPAFLWKLKVYYLV